MFAYGLIPKILEKVQNARRPERFTQDFLETKLGHSGGSARPIIPLLKRMGFLGSDGVPTDLYDKFRNSHTQGAAVAEGMRKAFGELFERNEYAYELGPDKLSGLIVETTGKAKDDASTKAIARTFAALNDLADFESDSADEGAAHQSARHEIAEPEEAALPTPSPLPSLQENDGVELRVGYTINLNLPETTDPEVFNAIFRSLKENLLKG